MERDYPDFRDFKYSLHSEYLEQPALPSKIDLRLSMSPIEDQGSLGSCVAHATCAVLEFLELQSIAGNISSSEYFGPKFDSISRLFLYYNARKIDGDPSKTTALRFVPLSQPFRMKAFVANLFGLI